jgi:SAM-dependent methyltransferase
LELGEANWYGDLNPTGLFPCSEPTDLFSVARDFYQHWCQPSARVAVDFDGTRNALRVDLNRPLALEQQFDVVINHGTMEHIFNVAQFLLTMHDRCKDGGLMIHDSPFTGWIDHGFYGFHPTLFYDLAAKNGYEVVAMAMHEIKSRHIVRLEDREHITRLAARGAIPNNAMLFAALRKRGGKPFRIPMQGIYSGALSAGGNQAWRVLR